MSRTLAQQIICKTMQLISDPRRWTKGRATRHVGAETRYCAFAALMSASSSLTANPATARGLAMAAEAHIVAANGWKPGSRLSHSNDAHSHRQVMAALRRAAHSRDHSSPRIEKEVRCSEPPLT